MLARRAQPAAALREKLLRTFPTDEVEPVIARFEELGLLDDGAYAETFVRDRFLRAGYGRERIRRDLLRKGVARAQIDAAIDAVVDAATERSQAEQALQRFRTRRARTDDPRKLREAAFRHLVGRGFALALVRELLDVSQIS
jgi:regulatory protein